ncbi:MAG: hypothetical protein UHD64_10090 [Bacteroidales bacterium]|nr:hypothetical protein [Bacteroidales bacterium]
MPRVYCANSDCISCENNECIRDFISIGDNECDICEDYEKYNETADYQHEFFVCVKAKDGRTAKAVKKGKLIEYKGVAFYTTDDDRKPDFMMVTDVRTGLGINFSMLQVEKWWQMYLEKSKEQPDVQTYPLAEWDERSREYIIKESEVQGE